MTDKPTIDAALAAWATTEPEGAGDAAALARIIGHADAIANPAPARRRWTPIWVAGGAVAASVAIAMLVAPTPAPGPVAGQDGQAVILAEASPDTSAAFALLYTPTIEEEYQL
jgi:hypothetical protein